MNAETLMEIKRRCEQVEKDTGFGKVEISFQHGKFSKIETSFITLANELLTETRKCDKP